jgi:hypothetical protein
MWKFVMMSSYGIFENSSNPLADCCEPQNSSNPSPSMAGAGLTAKFSCIEGAAATNLSDRPAKNLSKIPYPTTREGAAAK